MSYVFPFEKLEVWQLSRKLVVKIYQITNSFPDSERYGLTSQLRRAAVSVASNIAEGEGRRLRVKDSLRFISISYASLMEVMNQIILSGDLGFLALNELPELREDIRILSNKINSFYNFRQKQNSPPKE